MVSLAVVPQGAAEEDHEEAVGELVLPPRSGQAGGCFGHVLRGRREGGRVDRKSLQARAVATVGQHGSLTSASRCNGRELLVGVMRAVYVTICAYSGRVMCCGCAFWGGVVLVGHFFLFCRFGLGKSQLLVSLLLAENLEQFFVFESDP